MRATIHLRQSITDDDLRRISEENPGWQVERAADGSLLMSPTSTSSSARNMELAFQMAAFAKLIDPYARRVWSDGAPPEGFHLDLAAIFDA